MDMNIKEYEAFTDMIIEIVKNCESIEQAVEKLKVLLKK